MNKATALWLLAAVPALSCAGAPPLGEPGAGSPTATEAARIEGIEPQVLADRTRVVLRSNAPLLYTSYEPDSTQLVLEIQDVDVSALPPVQEVPGSTVGEIAVSSEKKPHGSSTARIEFRNLDALETSLRSVGTDLVVEFVPSPFLPPAAAETAAAAADAGPGAPPDPEPAATAAAAPPVGEGMPAPPAAPAVPPVDGVRPPDAAMPPAPAAEPLPPASRLEAVEPLAVPGGVRVVLRGDGAIEHRTFTLQNPDRLVLDLIGVRNVLGNRHLQVSSDPLAQIRVAQFKADPEPVCRVVLDLVAAVPYHVRAAGDALEVSVGQAAVAARQAEESEGLLRAAAAGTGIQPPDTAAARPAPAPAEAGAPGGEAAETAVAWVPAHDPPKAAAAVAGDVPLNLADMGLDPGGEDYVLFGQDPSYRPQDASTGLPQQFQPTTIAGEGPNYTGEKISVHFVEAELKNVFLFFSEFIGLNIVIDPEVRGKLTMHLDQVPWDQAFDVILRHQGLEKTVEGNVVRIATTEKLRAEAAQRQALKKAQEEEVDPVTFTQVLSYAKVDEVSPILIAGVKTDRGRVVQDPRTNTLIITDVPERQEAYQRLIDVLDKETEQVMIEARIVETDRNFEHNLGINWSLFASADPALGTQTDLDFPHRATVTYDVNLPAAASASTLGVSLGNVLDSFTLDIALDAFENEGKVRILSSPRITTQNNQPATIEQGTQIPVVTTTAVEINVQYISASLRLEVTPQITADGTVIMDVVVENNSPDFVNRVGDVPPIITEKAETQILVRDGSTAVIGGIFKLSESNAEAGIPGLRKIPVLGWLFKNRAITKANQELLVFITPKILKGGA